MENTMRPVIKKNLDTQLRFKLVMDVVGSGSISAKEVMKRSGLSRDLAYYVLATLVKDGHLAITPKITKKGQGRLNHYEHTSIPFIAKTVEELERIYPPGYFSKLRKDKRTHYEVNEKGPYDDMIAANPNLRKISAMFETRPELFKQEKRKPEHRGIPSTFGMYNMIPSGMI
jgi:predicted transcriptional regulator